MQDRNAGWMNEGKNEGQKKTQEKGESKEQTTEGNIAKEMDKSVHR